MRNRQKGENKGKPNNNFANLNPNISITSTLNINGLNLLLIIKSEKWSKQILKSDPTICCLKEIYFKYDYIGRLKLKG